MKVFLVALVAPVSRWHPRRLLRDSLPVFGAVVPLGRGSERPLILATSRSMDAWLLRPIRRLWWPWLVDVSHGWDWHDDLLHGLG